MNNKQLGLKIITVICLISIFIAIIYFLYSFFIPKIVYQYKSSNWSTVDGVVLYSYVTSSKSSSSDLFCFKYSYEVGDEKYSGGKFDMGYLGIKSFYFCFAFKALSRLYPRETKVRVYYDPDNPQLCTLNPGGIHWLFVVISCFLIFINYRIALTTYLLILNKVPVCESD